MRLINSIRKIYIGGLLGEIITLFVLLAILGEIFIFPISKIIEQLVDIGAYGEYMFFFVIIAILLGASSILINWLSKYGGNVVSKFGRRVVGLTAGISIDLLLFSTVAIIAGDLMHIVADNTINWITTFEIWQWDESDIKYLQTYLFAFLMLFIFFSLRGWLREALGKITQPFRDFLGERKMGIGGSSKFIGLLEEWKHRYKPNYFLLGTSLYDPDWKLGHQDDRHILTIGSPRSGKGGNAAVTSARRGKGGGRVMFSMGQEVHVIDPFNINGETAHFNPLSVLEAKSFTISEDIKIISEALGGVLNHLSQMTVAASCSMDR